MRLRHTRSQIQAFNEKNTALSALPRFSGCITYFLPKAKQLLIAHGMSAHIVGINEVATHLWVHGESKFGNSIKKLHAQGQKLDKRPKLSE